jgi:antitoxin VapB
MKTPCHRNYRVSLMGCSPLSSYVGWPMNIRSAKVDQLAQRLARLTGEDVETALERAIEERLSRVAPPASTDRKAALDSFFERVSRMPVLDPRPAEEIIGYDGCGLPS